jgi:hypothetical protein
MKYTSDFETTTDPRDCHVWAYGICEIGNPNYFTYGNNIDDFLKFCEKSNNATFYFHNLKFDGEFIMVRLFELGFKHVIDKKELDTKTFTTLISNKGQHYSIKIVFSKKGKRTNSVTIYDSLKILPFSVKQIAKGFNLPFQKGEIDYDSHNGVITPITDEELDYLKRDVVIVAMALDTIFKQGLEKMTQGSNALFDYKRTVTQKRFDRWFPIPDYDQEVRYSYKGGFTYLNPKYKELDIEEGVVLDVNSLYPSVMHDKPLPYGEGIYFEGQYKDDTLYNLYVQRLSCQFELKPNHIPTIQLKRYLGFIPTEYLTSSGDEEVTMTLTSVDLELFFEHYEVYNIEYLSGWKFKSTIGLFTEYIDKWTKVKIESKENDNYAMYILAKLMLNALYGKFATNPNIQSKIPYYDNGMIKYYDGEKDTKNPIYIPVGTFVTAWARYKTITSAQTVYDRFVYADTDSLHLVGTELPSNLDIDPVKLGAWDNEATFKRARFLRQKSYYESHIVSDKKFAKMEEVEKTKCYILDGVRVIDKITCAGLPESCYEFVTWENFRVGSSYSGKLQMQHVKGGIVLKEIDFSIKM